MSGLTQAQSRKQTKPAAAAASAAGTPPPSTDQNANPIDLSADVNLFDPEVVKQFQAIRLQHQALGLDKSICIAYLCWLFGGWFGLHHLYIGSRPMEAFLYSVSLGGFGLGWAYDFFRIPRLVSSLAVSNEHVAFSILKGNMRPSVTFVRSIASFVFGNWFYMVFYNAFNYYIGEDLAILPGSFGTAIALWLIGNIHPHKIAFFPILRNCGLGLLLSVVVMSSPGFCSTLIGTWAIKSNLQWHDEVTQPVQVKIPSRMKTITRISGVMLLTISFLFLGCVGVFNNVSLTVNGETLLLRTHSENILKSPMWSDLKESASTLWQFYSTAGMDGVWTEFMSLLDAKGETRAFKTLGLTSSATLPEVKKACRALRLENHPDKNLDAEAAAQAKFIEINEACDTLFKMFDERDGKAADEARQQQDDHQQQQQQKQREKRDMEHRVRAEQAAAVEKKRKEQAAREAVNDFEAAKEKFESAKQKRERLEAAAAAASWSQSTQKDSNLNNAARTKSKAGKNSQYN